MHMRCAGGLRVKPQVSVLFYFFGFVLLLGLNSFIFILLYLYRDVSESLYMNWRIKNKTFCVCDKIKLDTFLCSLWLSIKQLIRTYIYTGSFIFITFQMMVMMIEVCLSRFSALDLDLTVFCILWIGVHGRNN